MNKKFLLGLVATLLVMPVLAHDLAGVTEDGDSIWFNDVSTTLRRNVVEVTYRGNWYGATEGEYRDTINIPQTVTISNRTYTIIGIGEQAFAKCFELTGVTIPETIEYIKDGAFKDCYALAKVIYNAVNCADLTLPSFAPFSLGNMAYFEYVYDDDGYFESYWSAYGLREVIIGEKVERIPDFMFYGMGGMIEQVSYDRNYNLVIEDSKVGVEHIEFLGQPKYIGNQAFRSCRLLRSIELPREVTYLGQALFADCDTLSEVILPDNIEEIPAYFFKNCKELAEVEIPGTITRINYESFRGCEKMTEISLPEGLQIIGPSAFRSNANLLSVTFPSTLTTIDGYAFSDCTSLTEITIPDNVTEIGNYAFEDCTHLQHVTLGENTRLIGNFVFAGCMNMSKGTLNAPARMPQIQNNTFFGIANSMKVNVPTESLEQYINDPYWGRFFAPIGIEYIDGDSNYSKLYRDGQLLIQSNGSTYTISGQIIK